MTGYTSDFMPIICNDDRSLCLFVDDSQVGATVGDSSVTVTETVPALSWTHVALRMDAEGEWSAAEGGWKRENGVSGQGEMGGKGKGRE